MTLETVYSRGYRYDDLTRPLEVTITVNVSCMKYETTDDNAPYDTKLQFVISDDEAKRVWGMMHEEYGDRKEARE